MWPNDVTTSALNVSQSDGNSNTRRPSRLKSQSATALLSIRTPLESGEIVSILIKLKDGMSAGLADSQRAYEEDRKSDHATLVAATESEVATLTVTIETNLRQGGLGVEVDSMKGDLADTENSLTVDEASSEWEERQKSRAEPPQLMRRFLWPCDSTGGCPTAPQECNGFFFWKV